MFCSRAYGVRKPHDMSISYHPDVGFISRPLWRSENTRPARICALVPQDWHATTGWVFHEGRKIADHTLLCGVDINGSRTLTSGATACVDGSGQLGHVFIGDLICDRQGTPVAAEENGRATVGASSHGSRRLGVGSFRVTKAWRRTCGRRVGRLAVLAARLSWFLHYGENLVRH